MFTLALLKKEKIINERTWNIIIKDVRERWGHRTKRQTPRTGKKMGIHRSAKEKKIETLKNAVSSIAK